MAARTGRQWAEDHGESEGEQIDLFAHEDDADVDAAYREQLYAEAIAQGAPEEAARDYADDNCHYPSPIHPLAGYLAD